MSAGMTAADGLPRWVSLALLPAINITVALLVSALVILAIGEDPAGALWTMLVGAFGSGTGLGYTLYYATSLIFTGLSVGVAFHAGLFNIGSEGQAYIGGLGVGLVCLTLGGWPWWAALPLTVLAAMAFGGAWAFIPGYLQAYRGSHVVITTIMFNFLASALMVYLLVNVLIRPGQMSPESREIDPSLFLPTLHDMLGALGLEIDVTPLNLSFFLALAACLLVWLFIWHTRQGFALRTVGANEQAAHYAGIDPRRTVIVAMLISGALAGLLGINEIQGVQHRLMLNFPAGMGFTGIAVALMGRAHPAGIIPAAILFGALYQGGAELAFEYQSISPELVVVIQGVVILFAGALEHLFRPALVRLFARRGDRAAEA
ncbi:ABC transporter permease [Rhodospirillum centenum]|uniref:Sugar ABC transporter, permease protein, putative n=1 Tax=Rhodospirillum centenum (strain ATCC 51521 / SW) TaxID=414684 RepID=B6IQG3_RHOCS|nr:ABC transporter permease [Rhodospirillum centenum]ACI97699.1 sugar ABC transporter, permease protein, putative [Rhodospirillum centenum SW]